MIVGASKLVPVRQIMTSGAFELVEEIGEGPELGLRRDIHRLPYRISVFRSFRASA